MADYIFAKKEPVLKMLAVFNGSGTIEIENNPKTFGTLPHGSPVQATSTPNKFKLVKGFEVYEGVTGTDVKVKKNHLLGLTDAFNIGGAVTVTAIDYTTSDLYDVVTFSGSVTVTINTVYSQVPTAGKASLTFGQAPINNDNTGAEAFCAVLSEGLIDTDKLVLPAILDNTGLLKGITNHAIAFA